MEATVSPVEKIRDIADAIACGCTEAEIMADVEVLRAQLEQQER